MEKSRRRGKEETEVRRKDLGRRMEVGVVEKNGGGTEEVRRRDRGLDGRTEDEIQ